MKKNKIDKTENASWYSGDGKDLDVVLSTRVRLARNLANFPFPSCFKDDDDERVHTLVLDAFSKSENPEVYQAVPIKGIDSNSVKILSERGIFGSVIPSGVVMGPCDNVFCLVNSKDHVRLSSFVPGLDCKTSYQLCKNLDEQLQNSLQFAASYEFGFLNSSVFDIGSGMKISARVHLPSLTYTKKLATIVNSLKENGLTISATFGSGSFFSSSLGAYYQISTESSFVGSEVDQIISFATTVASIIELERTVRNSLKEEIPTEIKDLVSRNCFLAKCAMIVDTREAIEIVSILKWGLVLELVTGIEHKELSALLYRIQEGHLNFLLKNSTIKFEKDIEKDKNLQVSRLRALILHEVFENIKL